MTGAETFGAIVIGTGQGGKPLAGALAQAGWTVAILERDRVGGTCVVRGCTPTKTMLASARIAHLARRASDYGVAVGAVSVDLPTVRRRKRDIVDAWSSGSQKGLERHETLELIMGEGRFASAQEVEVSLTDGGTRLLRSDHIFINVGARTRTPDLPGLSEIDHLTSTSVMELAVVPEHLVVLGGGFIGLEFGQMFRRFGAEVTIVTRRRLAPREDPDISEALEEIFRGEGIRVVGGADAKRVDPEGGGITLTVEVDGSESTITGSHLMIAAGTESNADSLNVASAGIRIDERGNVQVNERCETSVDGIWALGDVTGAPPFTHTSYDDFRIIRKNLLEGGGGSRQDRVVPYAMFTDPQLGRVGMSETEARERGLEVMVARLPMTKVARAIEMDETRGFMKALVDTDSGQILGGAILGIEGGEVITVLQMAMMGGLPWTALRDAVIAHPTLSESLNNLFMTLD